MNTYAFVSVANDEARRNSSPERDVFPLWPRAAGRTFSSQKR